MLGHSSTTLRALRPQTPEVQPAIVLPMDAQNLKDDIAWYQGAIAGWLNSEVEDEETLRFLLNELEARWVLLQVVDPDTLG